MSQKLEQDPTQVLAMALETGALGKELIATRHYTGSSDFQDNVGETLVQLAGVVPDGMLVFMPSYVLLNKLRKRWQATGAQDVGASDSCDAVMPPRRASPMMCFAAVCNDVARCRFTVQLV